jgi:hypothetical protein
MGMPPTKLSEAFVRNLTFKDKPFSVRDTVVKGLMITVNRNTKSYKVQRDLWVGQKGRRRKVKTVRLQSKFDWDGLMLRDITRLLDRSNSRLLRLPF